MRLVFTSPDPQEARTIAGILKSDGIITQLEVKAENDWGSPQYGDLTSTVWVIDEDRFEEALNLIEKYKENPNHEIFKQTSPQKISDTPPTTKRIDSRKYQKPTTFNASPQGITLFFLILCSFLYVLTSITEPNLTTIPNYLPATPLISSPTKKELIYDYPKAYEITDKLVKLYGMEKLETPNDLSPEGKSLLKKLIATPYWQGLYQTALDYHKGFKEQSPPLFEKIRQGEFWRLFTPALLHSDILHLLFNMLWLAVLGKQIEQHIGKLKYLLFILIAAVFSNTCQYIVGGINFVGFSGVVCAMLTFICMRQKIAPWEGYPLERSTSIFLIIFIIAMGTLQALSFVLEATQNVSISPGIANTAHLTGAVIGIVMGSLPYFSWKG